jgi:hypothetical protein
VAVEPLLGTVLGPLVAEQAALRQTVERQAEQLVSQAETIGRQSERVATLELENGRLAARLEPQDTPTAPYRARRWPHLQNPPGGEPLKASVLAAAPWAITVLAIIVAVAWLLAVR